MTGPKYRIWLAHSPLLTKRVSFPKDSVLYLPRTPKSYIISAFLNITSIPMTREFWPLHLSDLIKATHSTTWHEHTWIPPNSGDVIIVVSWRDKSVVPYSEHHGGMDLQGMQRCEKKLMDHFIAPPPENETYGVWINISKEERHIPPSAHREHA